MSEHPWWHQEWVQRRALNESFEELVVSETTPEHLAERLRALLELERLQSQELTRINAALWTLVDLLVEDDRLERAEYEQRLSATLALLRPDEATAKRRAAARAQLSPPPLPANPNPAPGSLLPPDVAAVGASTICVACGKEVPAADTYVTEKGELCDSCYRHKLAE
jgi:hypothetical protein